MNPALWKSTARFGDAKPGGIWLFRELGAVSELTPTGDIELLQRIASGDSAALGEFYDRHSSLLFTLAARIVADPKEAEDVLQEVFVQLWDKASQFDSTQGRPLAWVLTLTRHKAIDRLRSTQRRRTRLVEQTDDNFEQPAPSASAAENAGAAEQGEIIRAALARLPVHQRRAIELAFFDGLSQTEVAAALNEPLGTVKARIRRGMLKLRAELEPRS